MKEYFIDALLALVLFTASAAVTELSYQPTQNQPVRIQTEQPQ
jgi:hypothetical protein